MAEIKLTGPFSQVVRIGVAEKTHGNPRPMRARTTCITDERNILKGASILKDTEDYKVIYTTKGDACVCVCVCLQNWTNFCPYALISTPNVP